MRNLALILLAGIASANAESVISWNLNDWSDSPTGATPTAGVVPAPYWNDTYLDGLANPALNLRDNTGAATTLDVSWSSTNGTWNQSGFSHVGPDSDGTLNREVISGYLNGTGADSTSVTLSEIPYSSYDVYVYFAADNYSRSGTVTDGTTTYSFGVLDNMIAGADALLAQTTDTGLGYPEANYAVFSGLTGTTQTFSTSFPLAGEYGGIAAIQVVANAGAVPEFTTQPSNQFGDVGGTTTLTAVAISTPAPDFQWQYSADGFGPWTDLTDTGNISGSTTATLTLSPAEFSDNGFYRLVASNPTEVISDEVEVYNTYPDPTITGQPQGGAVQVGDSASFTVQATGLGTLTYQWYNYNTGMLSDGGTISGTTTATLTVTNIQLADADDFYCEVTDLAATEDSSGEFDTYTTTEVATLEVFEVPAADLLSFEPFISYPNGVQLPGQNPAIDGYINAWLSEAFGTSAPATSTGSLVYGGAGYQPGIGGKAGKAADAGGIAEANSGRTARELDINLKGTALSSRTIYLSWLYQTGNENAAADPNVNQTLALWNGNSGNDALRVFQAGISTDFGFANFGFSVLGTPVDLTLAPDANVHLFVAKFVLSPTAGSDSVTVWIDPTLGAGEPVGGLGVTGLDLVFDRLALSDYASDSTNWDEIRWGQTFDSVTIASPSVPLVPEFTLQPVNFSGEVGGTMVLSAFAEGSPEPGYQWQYSADGLDPWSNLSNGGSNSGADSSELTISPAAYADNGYYRVIANNGNGGDQTSDEVLASLTYPLPVVTGQPASVPFAAEGSNVSFTVTATYLGPVAYEWYKVDGGGDILLTNGGNISGADTDTLQFTGVTAGDAGEYYVKVIDNAGLADTGFGTTAFSASAALSTYTPLATGNVVSWNLNVNGDSPTDASATAGVVAAPYWNDTWIDALANPALDLRDSSGATTSIDISWESYATYNIQGSHPGADTDGTLNKEILNGYLSSGPAAWNPPITHSAVTVSEIPFTSYDIIVYFSSDVAGREGDVTDGATNYSFNTLGPASLADGDALLAQTTDVGGTYATAANYAVFSGLSGTSQTITVQMRDDDEWGGIAAIQIVPPSGAGDDFATWIGSYPGVGGLTGFNDDADGDGLSNGLENFLGTDPSLFNQGVTNSTKSGSTFTFEHPQNDTPASDVLAAYRWSPDLVNWYGSGASDGTSTVTFAPSTAGGTTTVTATIGGTVPTALFVDIEVTQAP